MPTNRRRARRNTAVASLIHGGNRDTKENRHVVLAPQPLHATRPHVTSSFTRRGGFLDARLWVWTALWRPGRAGHDVGCVGQRRACESAVMYGANHDAVNGTGNEDLRTVASNPTRSVKLGSSGDPGNGRDHIRSERHARAVIVSSTVYGHSGGNIPSVMLGSRRDATGNMFMIGTGRERWPTVRVADLAGLFRRVPGRRTQIQPPPALRTDESRPTTRSTTGTPDPIVLPAG